MSFRDMVAADIHDVFLDPEYFGTVHTVEYDGNVYEEVPLVIRDIKELERSQLQNDHAQGLYQTTTIMHAALKDIGGVQPEEGQRMSVSDKVTGFMREFYIRQSYVEMGMCHISLQAIDE